MKAFTDIEQSRKLAKILPIESADCFWDYDEMQKFHRISWFEDGYNKESQLMLNENNVCAWSLAALLDVLPDRICLDNENYYLNFQKDKVEYLGYMTWDGQKCVSAKSNTIVDAAFEMVVWLKENGKI